IDKSGKQRSTLLLIAGNPTVWNIESCGWNRQLVRIIAGHKQVKAASSATSKPEEKQLSINKVK
ncbi:hypothetical protein ON021_33940, partial [Microcoleus sp. HI-ES]|nr:hypothetical protein [Microcoleus sp. HI-ES]